MVSQVPSLQPNQAGVLSGDAHTGNCSHNQMCRCPDYAGMVQGKTTELEQTLRQKEMEIEHLRRQLDSKKSDGSSDSSVDVCAAVELDEDPSAAYANEVSCSTLHLPATPPPPPPCPCKVMRG